MEPVESGSASGGTDSLVSANLDRRRPLVEANDIGHTRWHPDIPPIAFIRPGAIVEADVRDGGDRQITLGDTSHSDINRLHPLTGPFFIEGAEQGDLVRVELLKVWPDDFGWTAVRRNGQGLMRDLVDEDLVITWRIEDGVARSPDLPGIAILGAPFMGIVGVAPSRERLTRIRRREAAVNEAGGWALMPGPEGARPAHVANEGLRTMAPREIGGNLDVKDLAEGASITLPVDVPGGLLSFGDPHFSQGDGESFGTAIETSARIRFRCQLRKAVKLRWRPTFPFLETTAGSPVRSARAELITTGMSIGEEGGEHYLDVTLAARRALIEMRDHLVQERRLALPQAHILISVAADLRVSVVNNPPTAVAAVALPLDVFEGKRSGDQ